MMGKERHARSVWMDGDLPGDGAMARWRAGAHVRGAMARGRAASGEDVKARGREGAQAHKRGSAWVQGCNGARVSGRQSRWREGRPSAPGSRRVATSQPLDVWRLLRTWLPMPVDVDKFVKRCSRSD